MIEIQILLPTDEELAEFLKLQQEIKQKSRRMDEIRKACKEAGSFCTANHACVVYEQEQRRLIGLEEASSIPGALDFFEKYDMIKVLDFLVVKIARR